MRKGEGGELALLPLVSAPRAGAKNRGGEIFRQSQDAFGRRRERERGSRRGREERGRRGRGRGKEGGPQFPNPRPRSPRGPASGSRAGTQGRPGCGGGENCGDSGLRPTETAGHPAGRARAATGRSQDQCALGRQREACGRPKHTPAPRRGTTGFCPRWARATGGATAGHHRRAASREGTKQPACWQPLTRPPSWASCTMSRGQGCQGEGTMWPGTQ